MACSCTAARAARPATSRRPVVQRRLASGRRAMLSCSQRTAPMWSGGWRSGGWAAGHAGWQVCSARPLPKRDMARKLSCWMAAGLKYATLCVVTQRLRWVEGRLLTPACPLSFSPRLPALQPADPALPRGRDGCSGGSPAALIRAGTGRVAGAARRHEGAAAAGGGAGSYPRGWSACVFLGLHRLAHLRLSPRL